MHRRCNKAYIKNKFLSSCLPVLKICHSSAEIRRRRNKAYAKEIICHYVILSKKHVLLLKQII